MRCKHSPFLLAAAALALACSVRADPLASRIGKDGLKLTTATVTQGTSQEPTRLSFTVENQTGQPLRIGVLQKGVVLGECTTVQSVSGIPYLVGDEIDQAQDKNNRIRALTLVPNGGSATGVVSLYQCTGLPRAGEVKLAVTLVVADDDEVVNIPLTGKARIP